MTTTLIYNSFVQPVRDHGASPATFSYVSSLPEIVGNLYVTPVYYSARPISPGAGAVYSIVYGGEANVSVLTHDLQFGAVPVGTAIEKVTAPATELFVPAAIGTSYEDSTIAAQLNYGPVFSTIVAMSNCKDEELFINKSAANSALFVLNKFYEEKFPAPQISRHGPNSAVLSWHDDNDNVLYLTITPSKAYTLATNAAGIIASGSTFIDISVKGADLLLV